jgi:hypothetical protein
MTSIEQGQSYAGDRAQFARVGGANGASPANPPLRPRLAQFTARMHEFVNGLEGLEMQIDGSGDEPRKQNTADSDPRMRPVGSRMEDLLDHAEALLSHAEQRLASLRKRF